MKNTFIGAPMVIGINGALLVVVAIYGFFLTAHVAMWAMWQDRSKKAEARKQRELAPSSTAVVLEAHRPREQVDRLVLLAVVLQAERAARRDVKNFSHILLGMRPDELVSPGFLDPPRRVAHIIRHDFRRLGHAPEGSHGALRRQPARQRTCRRVTSYKDVRRSSWPM